MKNGTIEITDGEFVWENDKSKEIAQKFTAMLSTRIGEGRGGHPGGHPGGAGHGGPPQNGGSSPKKPAENNGNDQKAHSPLNTESKYLVDKNNGKPEDSKEKKESVTLRNINLSMNPGEIYAVVGSVGSGKSSFVHAIIGEMFKNSGKVNVKGSIAYIAQNAWIVNGTLRDNIIMNKPFDKAKYKRVIRLCELRDDIKTFPGKDLIEIGSKGINLSGGQKQRISIARALYADADIYIIDDCLSALDAHVGKAIYNNVILGAISNKTRFLVTHALHFLKNLDHILVMSKGEIVARGSYDILIRECEEFKKLTQVAMEKQSKAEEEKVLRKLSKQSRKDSALIDEKDSETEKEDPKKALIPKGEKLTQIEVQEVGGVKFQNYILLFVYSGCCLGFWVLLFFFMAEGLLILTDWWVGIWGSNSYGKSNSYYMGVYGGISGGQILANLIRGFLYMKLVIAIAKGTQMRLVWAIMRAPLRWFDQTPIGRIINRACKDQATIDTDIVWLLQGTIKFSLQIIGSLVLIGSVTPWFFIELVVIVILYIYYFGFSIQASRDCRRIESVYKSPIFAQFGETLDGLTSIRAYKFEKMMDERMMKSIANSNDAYFMTMRCSRWLNLRVDMLAALAVAGAYLFATIARESGIISPPLIGLSISQSLAIVNYVGLMLMMLGMLDIRMNSVERIAEYIEQTPTEKEFEEPQPKSVEWPEKGEIKFDKVFFRYRDELPNVIHGISLDIKPHEKIGIAGRTGSGKSTMTLGLLRIIEPYNEPNEKTENRIVIDGQDIEKIGLHCLRQKIAIIPQDAILFSGTVRNNLDPFRDVTEEHDLEILNVLSKVKLLSAIYRKVLVDEKKDESEIQQINDISPYFSIF